MLLIITLQTIYKAKAFLALFIYKMNFVDRFVQKDYNIGIKRIKKFIMQHKLHDVLKYCDSHKIHVTSQQVLILEIIVASPKAVTANEILVKLKEANPKANRMTIHRALEYLVKANLIHRIVYNLTYKLCNHLSTHNCQILICQKCGRQIELHSENLRQTLADAGTSHGFVISNPIEITGYCKECVAKPDNMPV